jgi:hypothetical protein
MEAIFNSQGLGFKMHDVGCLALFNRSVVGNIGRSASIALVIVLSRQFKIQN